MRISLAFLLLMLPFSKDIAQTPQSICIANVNVVDVKTGKIIPEQNVIIENGRITTVGSAKRMKLPHVDTTIIGSGKYLMPGMTDAHIHFFQSGGLYTRPDALNLGNVYSYEKDQQWIKDNLSDMMARYLACGITTVIDVGGPFSNYTIREKLVNDSQAPTAFVTGPLISTYQPPNLDKKDPPIIKVTSADEARELVRKQLPYKPDFIKIWYIVLPNQSASSTLPIVQATIDESHKNGLKVAVHATEYETAKLAVAAGADILVHSVDDKVLDKEMLQLLVSKKVAYIPTMIVAQNYARTFTQQFNFTPHDYKYANPFMLGTLQDIMHVEKLPFNYKTIRSRFLIPGKEDSMMATNLKLAQQSGVLVVAGTDAGNIGTQHASSFHDELLAMQNAGLSNKEILQSATINAAIGFGKDSLYGSVEKGKMADLLLLNKDPLQDINIPASLNTIFRHGVAIRPGDLVKVTPEMLAQQQLNAYNLRDIDAFLEPYSDTVELYNFSGKLMMKGKEAMRKSYSDMFKNTPDLHCKLINRIVEGNTVIDHESVTGWGDKPVKAVAIYTVANGKIVKVHFIQ
jgi:imidazolonepropionase-like amidohydrolase